VSEHFQAFKEWVATIREDINTLEHIVENEKVDVEARKLAAAGLNYVVTRMDLVPDWEESVGVLDDVMVLRVLVELACQHGLDEVLEDTDDTVAVARLSNEASRVDAYLGTDLGASFRKYCARLVDETVRGRSPATIVSDAEQRKKLFDEVEADLKRMPPAPFASPDEVDLRFRSYLGHKLSN
jgi:uncharacterized membrane protein YkvA (DUF1232 family)